MSINQIVKNISKHLPVSEIISEKDALILIERLKAFKDLKVKVVDRETSAGNILMGAALGGLAGLIGSQVLNLPALPAILVTAGGTLAGAALAKYDVKIELNRSENEAIIEYTPL